MCMYNATELNGTWDTLQTERLVWAARLFSFVAVQMQSKAANKAINDRSTESIKIQSFVAFMCRKAIIYNERNLHTLQMGYSWIARKVISGGLGNHERKLGWPGENRMDVVRRDLKDVDTRCREEAKELATDRTEWCQRVAKCIH